MTGILHARSAEGSFSPKTDTPGPERYYAVKPGLTPGLEVLAHGFEADPIASEEPSEQLRIPPANE